MKFSSLFSRQNNPLLNSFQSVVVGAFSYLQHILMKAAVAASLQLCLFTARVLLKASPSSHGRTSRSY
ncbi:MAG: hypothetical protein AAFN38_05855 [Cyanobacteria bacterium J06560_5]